MNLNIFRERDIRGKYPEEINEEIFEKAGNAFAQLNENIAVARDARNESPQLMKAFVEGACAAGKHITVLGLQPQACAITWVIDNKKELAYITGSHLPCGQNGVKFFHSTGAIYNKEEVEQISTLVKLGKYLSANATTPASIEPEEALNNYIEKSAAKINPGRKIRVLLDCGNGVNGLVARDVFSKAGFDTDVIFEEPDGNFPNRGPDPKTDPLNELRKMVRDYDIGIAYDADGDRFFVVSEKGEILATEHVVYILLSALYGKGDVVANVECGRAIDAAAEKFGRKTIRVPVGVKDMENAVVKNNAVLGIESSQHCFVPSLTEFSDAIAASMLVAKVIADTGKTVEEFVKDIHTYPTVRRTYECPDDRKFSAMERLEKNLSSAYTLNSMDGIRVDLKNGWVLVRPSQTEGVIRMTIEADSTQGLEEIEKEFAAIVEREIYRNL